MMRGEHQMMPGPWSYFHMAFAGLIGLAVLVLLVLAIIWLLKLIRANGVPILLSSKPHEDALMILSRRYANGEIPTEEFLERKQHLSCKAK
jgi:uncharacterized membrane protein